jgi:CheY-like chemotaxis protein
MSGAKLTGHLLGLTRKGRQEIQAVQMNRLVRETSETFGRTRKDLTMHLDMAPGLPTVLADPSQIEQILWNLYINAADAMPAGGRIYIRTRTTTHEAMAGKPFTVKPGRYVMLSVQDTGPGMAPEAKVHAFEPFFTTKQKGTGLGLATVYGVVKGCGGYVDVDSPKEGGAVFSILLPASESVLEETCEPEATASEPVKGTGTVLLVDDENSVRDIGKEMLTSLGYTVFTAASGEEAVVFCENHPRLDAVILDLVMPGMGGPAAFERIKAFSCSDRVLLASGLDADESGVSAMTRECGGFIQKPFTLQELSKVLAGILKKSQ